ncbi:MAG: sodium/proton-translocating pyrophosphatase, partial [Clostridia bacterium]
MNEFFYAVPAVGVIALLFAFILSSRIEKAEVGTDRMKEISSYIQEGAMAFLAREYKSLAIFVVVLFFALTFLIDWQTAVCFIVGG